MAADRDAARPQRVPELAVTAFRRHQRPARTTTVPVASLQPRAHRSRSSTPARSERPTTWASAAPGAHSARALTGPSPAARRAPLVETAREACLLEATPDANIIADRRMYTASRHGKSRLTSQYSGGLRM